MTYLMILVSTLATWWSRGNYNAAAPLLTLLFLIWVFVRIMGLGDFESSKIRERFVRIYPWLGALMMALRPGVIYVADGIRPALVIFRLFPALILGTTAKLKEREWIGAVSFLAFFLFTLILCPHPNIDVFTSNSAAVDFFTRGLNPYSQTYPDIYHGAYNVKPGLVYWPSILYLETISKLVFFDIRVVLVLAWWSAAFLLSEAFELRLIWWSIPFLAFGFEQAWLDPVLSFCAVLALRSIQKKQWLWLSFAAALAASTKQYGFVVGFFSLAWVALQEKRSVFLKTSFVCALFFTAALAPFLIWSLRDFIQMTIGNHTGASIRPEALNFTAFWLKATGQSFSNTLQAVFAGLGFFLGSIHLLKNRRKIGIRVIPEACAMAFGFSMYFGKFAFCNYHWFLISFWLMAASVPAKRA